MGKKEFAVVALDLEYETFVVHITSLSTTSLNSSPLDVYPFRRPQIADLMAKDTLTKVPAEYLNFADVFSPDLASKLPEYTWINDHAIKLVDNQQPPYGPIYSLGLMKLETLKADIETNLANRFIRLFKSPASARIIFDRKSDDFLCLCVNY